MKRILTATRDFARRLCRREDGNVFIMFALAAFTIIPAMGMAIDAVRMYTVKVQLGAALDAAGLAVASSTNLTAAQQQARLNKYFYGNFPTNIGVATSLNMTTDATNADAYDLTATARVQPFIMQLAGFGAVNVAVSAQVTKEPTGLEVAFVLDNTGSMWAVNGGVTNIQALINDTVDVINILFGAQTTNNKLKMSIVPFVTAVNVGSIAPSIIAAGSLPTGVNYASSTSFNASSATQWKGCLEEPNAPSDTSESAPIGSWKPYWWPSDHDTTVSPGPYLNPWTSTDVVVNNTLNDTHLSHSPNLSCATPLTRLTSDKQTLLNAANAMTAWDRSGTMIHVGAAWGWRTISPTSVFTGDALAYNTPSWKKAIIIESDGTNNFNDAGSNCKDLSGNQVYVWVNGVKTVVQCPTADYTAFGFLEDNRLGQNRPTQSTAAATTTAKATLDTRLTTVCTNIKAKGIIVYAIGFGSAGSISPALSGCAGNGGSYFLAPDQATLQATFQTIANQLNAIRLSK
jgi:Flp pilus assembly protein TadG